MRPPLPLPQPRACGVTEEGNGIRYTTREAVERLEARMDARLAEMGHDIRDIKEKQDRMLGASGFARWAAPVVVGIIGVILTLVATGVHL